MPLSPRVFAPLAGVVALSCLADVPDLVVGGGGASASGGAGAGGTALPGFCDSLATAPIVCEDFDGSGELPGPPWELALDDPRAHVELASSNVSPPSSLRAWVDEPMGGDVEGCLYAKLTYPFEEDHPILVVELDVRSTAPGVAVALQWSAADPSTSCLILLYNYDASIEVTAQAIPPATTYPSLMVPDVEPALPGWRHIELTLDRSGVAPTVALGSGDMLELDPDWWALCDGPAANLRLDLGSHCVGDPGTTTDSTFDNVVVTAP